MAEARLGEEEEELRRDRRDCAATRRGRRGQGSNPTTGCSERNKPEQRSSSQGPLSSIRAAIKRTTSTRTPSQTELQRERRRRPEITVIAAEPLGPAPWFPGTPGSCAAPAGLAFPSRPPEAHWRINEHASAELPPSYDQVIREISQDQVTTRTSNASPGRSTTTIATQTDFEEDGKNANAGSHQNSCLNLIDADFIFLQSLPEPLLPNSPGRPVENEPVVISFENNSSKDKRDQENDSPLRYPVPKPRTKAPTQEAKTGGQVDKSIVSIPAREAQTIPTQTPLEENSPENQVVVEAMNSDNNQNSILSRIKAFEAQNNAENSTTESLKRPEVLPRSLSKPEIAAGKPMLGPKPSVANRTSGEWDIGTDSKQKAAAREGPPLLPKFQAVGPVDGNKPEPPKKPKPVFLSSINNGSFDRSNEASTGNSADGEKKRPTPAPRPTVPKKSVSMDNKTMNPIIPAPRLSVAARAKAFTAAEEGSKASQQPTPFLKPRSGSEPDLISFDDDDVPPARPVSTIIESNSSGTVTDPFQVLAKNEPGPVELPSRPPPARKPTVILIPSQQSKSSSEDVHIPPPLPAENPVGNFSGAVNRKPTIIGRAANLESKRSEWTGASCAQPVLPPRPLGGKIPPARPPPAKAGPGRPPPPKMSRSQMPASSQAGSFKRSSSDVGFSTKQSASGFPKSKSQVFRKPGVELPPRPGPGHPLYNKYTLTLPHGIAERDFVSRVPGELSVKRGEVLLLLQQIDRNNYQCQKGDEIGNVQTSNMKIIIPLDEDDGSMRKGQPSTYGQKDGDSSGVPRALVLYDFVAEHSDDLNLKAGETVYLLERLDNEWYKGKCKGNTGIFPADFVKVIVDVSDVDNGKKTSSPSPSCISGPRCMARFDFHGEQQDELSFCEGDIIQLKEYVGEEWARGELRGQTGMFPINFVEIIEDLPATGLPPAQNKVLGSGVGAPSVSKKEPSQSSQGDRSSGQWCEALYDFTAETGEDLAFKQGDKIQLLEQLDSEWYRGKLDGREGIFPAGYVQLISGPAGRVKTQPKGSRKGKAKALYDFNSENEDELSFKAGDSITVIEILDAEWMSGELRGKSGIFPSNYVQIIQEPC